MNLPAAPVAALTPSPSPPSYTIDVVRFQTGLSARPAPAGSGWLIIFGTRTLFAFSDNPIQHHHRLAPSSTRTSRLSLVSMATCNNNIFSADHSSFHRMRDFSFLFHRINESVLHNPWHASCVHFVVHPRYRTFRSVAVKHLDFFH